MAKSLGNASLLTSVDLSGLTSGLQKSSTMINGWALKVGDQGAIMGKSIWSGLAAYSGMSMFQGLKDLGSEILATAKRADTLGISFAQLESYHNLGGGVDAETIDVGLTKIQRKVRDALVGNQAAIQSFHQLGIELGDIRGKDLGEVFELVAEKSGQMTNTIQRNALMMDLFGKSGGEMAAALKNVEKSKRQTAEFGLDIDVSGVKKMGGAFKTLKLAIKGIQAQFLEVFAPMIAQVVNMFTQAWVAAMPFVKGLKEVFSYGWQLLVDALGRIWEKIKGVGGAFTGIMPSIDTMVSWAKRGLDILAAAFEWIADIGVSVFKSIAEWVSNNSGIVKALAVGLGVAAGVLLAFTGGIAILQGVLWAIGGILATAFSPLVLVVAAIAGVAGAVIYFVGWENALKLVNTALDTMSAVWSVIWGALQPVRDGLGSIFGWFGGIIGAMFDMGPGIDLFGVLQIGIMAIGVAVGYVIDGIRYLGGIFLRVVGAILQGVARVREAWGQAQETVNSWAMSAAVRAGIVSPEVAAQMAQEEQRNGTSPAAQGRRDADWLRNIAGGLSETGIGMQNQFGSSANGVMTGIQGNEIGRWFEQQSAAVSTQMRESEEIFKWFEDQSAAIAPRTPVGVGDIVGAKKDVKDAAGQLAFSGAGADTLIRAMFAPTISNADRQAQLQQEQVNLQRGANGHLEAIARAQAPAVELL